MEGDEIFERAPWVDFVAGPGEVERVGDLVSGGPARPAPDPGSRASDRLTRLSVPGDQPRFGVQRVSHRHRRLRSVLHLLHRPFHSRAGAQPAGSRDPGRGGEPRGSRLLGDHSARPDGQRVSRCRRRASGSAELLERVADDRRHSETAVHHLASELRRRGDGSGASRAEATSLPICIFLPSPGSSRILYRMKRRYDRAGYLDAVGRVRRSLPEVAISSDFIVGFPGETDADFEDTLSLIREVRFSNVFAFVYSPRPGTASARWGREQSVPAETSAERLARLLALQEEIQAEENRSLVGRVMEILVEGTKRQGTEPRAHPLQPRRPHRLGDDATDDSRKLRDGANHSRTSQLSARDATRLRNDHGQDGNQRAADGSGIEHARRDPSGRARTASSFRSGSASSKPTPSPSRWRRSRHPGP